MLRENDIMPYFREVTGFTQSLDFPVTPGAFQTTFQGEQDAFIAKLNTVVIPHPIPIPPRSRGISMEMLTQFKEI